MDRSALKDMGYLELKELAEEIDVILEEKRREAEAEYQARAEALAKEYGFKVAGRAGRPKKPRRPRSNGASAET